MTTLEDLMNKIEKSKNASDRETFIEKFIAETIGNSLKTEHSDKNTNFNKRYDWALQCKKHDAVCGKMNFLHEIYHIMQQDWGSLKDSFIETYKLGFIIQTAATSDEDTEAYISEFNDTLLDIGGHLCELNDDFSLNVLSWIRDKVCKSDQDHVFHVGHLRHRLDELTKLLLALEGSKYCKHEFNMPLNKIFEESGKVNSLIFDGIKAGKCSTLNEVLEISFLDLPANYVPIKKLGKGGSGSVYLVENTIDKLEEAVKILTLSSDKGPEDVRRAIESELQVRRLNKMRCPYITMYYSVTYRNGKYLISMEPFEKTLEERMSEVKGRLPLYEATRYYEQLCHVLALCHKNNIIHKDLAPHNIGIDAEGNIKLSDFGNPLTTMDKKLKQPPLDYSSPRLLALPDNELEVLKDDNVWALGVILYEMLTGEKPFSSKDIERSDRKTRKEYIRDQQNKALQDNFNKLISQIDISDDAAEEWFQVNKGTFWPQYRNFNLMYERDSFNQEHADFDLWQISKHLKAEMIKEVLKKELLDLFDQISEHKEKYNIYETRFTLRLILNLNKYRSESIPENK